MSGRGPPNFWGRASREADEATLRYSPLVGIGCCPSRKGKYCVYWPSALRRLSVAVYISMLVRMTPLCMVPAMRRRWPPEDVSVRRCEGQGRKRGVNVVAQVVRSFVECVGEPVCH